MLKPACGGIQQRSMLWPRFCKADADALSYELIPFEDSIS